MQIVYFSHRFKIIQFLFTCIEEMTVSDVLFLNRLKYEKTIDDHEKMIAKLEENIEAYRVKIDDKNNKHEIQVRSVWSFFFA